MIEKIYNIGDTVWCASFDLRHEQITCPICLGKLSVTLILGNGDHVILPCDYCGKGYEGPRGVIVEYIREPRSEAIVISGRAITEGGDKREVRYHSQNSRSYGPEDVFDTQEEALAEAQKRADIVAEEEKTRAEYIKKDKNKSYSWNAGYHLREVKRAREQIAYHEKMASICKAKAKGEET